MGLLSYRMRLTAKLGFLWPRVPQVPNALDVRYAVASEPQSLEICVRL